VASPDRTKIDNDWPAQELEYIENCPYCGSKVRNIAYQGVQDWSFYCAPGKWTYWDCTSCSALYLSPRPTKLSIGRAYDTYYTHGSSNVAKVFSAGKTLVRNLCYFAWYGIDLRPRFSLSKLLFPLLEVFRNRVVAPSFILQELNNLPKGRLIDVGCGDGAYLDAAKQLGWQTLGIEFDPKSAKIAEKSGHQVIQGTYEALAAFQNEIDCIICSHVLEHVHDPKALLTLIANALKLGGVSIFSLPNAGSVVRSIFADSWRGLEAPRHLAIPQFQSLLELTCAFGFELKLSTVSRLETLEASSDIVRKRGVETPSLQDSVVKLRAAEIQIDELNADFINIVLVKKSIQIHSSDVMSSI
jgi:SAM-dependent methyltransferase